MPSDKSAPPGQFNFALGVGAIRMFARASQTITPISDVPDRHSQTRKVQANPFASVVSREVRRAIRTKCDLSLALFRIEGGGSDAVPLLDLVTTCVKRNLRATDEYAVLADNLVAVLLLETDGAGASAYAQRLLREMSKPRVSAQTHSHPSAMFDDFRAGNFGSAR